MAKPKESATHIGGQAVIEGVMIRNKAIYTIAVRKPDGTISVTTQSINSPAQRSKALRAPFVRGIVVLIENLVLGIKSLLYSAEVAMPEEEKRVKKEKRVKEEREGTKTDSGDRLRSGNADIIVLFGMVPALLLGVGLFMILPNISTHYIGVIEENRPFLFNFVAGGIRLAVFVIYILAISFMRDIKRTFQYHGAEHKCIYCYEAEKPLVIEEAKPFKTLHPRCGTSFLFFVFFITILVFPLVTVCLRFVIKDFAHLHILYRKLITILLHMCVALPIIASISYELLKLTDRLKSSFVMKALIAPGLLLQRITTKEPDDAQLEVAMEAVKAVTST
jgi:uncharacterized protein YqhQ